MNFLILFTYQFLEQLWWCRNKPIYRWDWKSDAKDTNCLQKTRCNHNSTSLVQLIIFQNLMAPILSDFLQRCIFIPNSHSLIHPVFHDWAVPECCWNCLKILSHFGGTFLPLCNFRMERHSQNLRFSLLKIYLLPWLSMGLLQLYLSTNTLLVWFLTESSLMITSHKNLVKCSNQHDYRCSTSRCNPPDGLLPKMQCRWQQG